MSGGGEDEADKSHEATPEKLRKAREKGEVARSTDLSVAASYGGLLLAALAVGLASIEQFGTALMVLLDQPDRLAPLFFDGAVASPFGGLLQVVAAALSPWFIVPATVVLLSILAQRAFVVAPSKLAPKLSRISLISNAKNKFGRSGLFEFFKSFVKLLLYSVCLYFFLRARLEDIVAVVNAGPWMAVAMLGRYCVEFLFIALLISIVIGGIDAVWQHKEHLRKNQMSRKEVMDESKDSEGDPHMKQHRRARAQEIALSKMMADVPTADVVIVNPTHYAVALKWSRKPGSAPICVAKGIDEVAGTIRRIAAENAVPIHSDPPTARALHATLDVGDQIAEDLFGPVAAAIRFAENMRLRAKGRV
ncbi:MAG: flagellar biosynthesis protein FlhB [Sedimentitalea sp.]